MKSLISDRRIYLTAGGEPVEETHKQRLTLLVGKGGTLRGDLAAKHNITLTDGRLTLPEAPEDGDDDEESIPPATGPEKVQAYLATLTHFQLRALLTHFKIEDKFGSPSHGELSYDAQIALLIHFLITEQGKFGEADIEFLQSIDSLEDPTIDGAADSSATNSGAAHPAGDQTQQETLEHSETLEQQEAQDMTSDTNGTGETTTPQGETAIDEKAVDAAPEDKAIKSAPENKSLKGTLQTKSRDGNK